MTEAMPPKKQWFVEIRSKIQGKQIFLEFYIRYINGVEDAIKGDYGISYLHPSSKTNCDLVNNIDFALVFTFGDNDFGGFFEECAKIYENKCWDNGETLVVKIQNGIVDIKII